jgi:Tfp pilus assembly PilM family ATPase
MSEVAIEAHDGELRFSEIGHAHGALAPRVFGVVSLPEVRLDNQDQKAREEVIKTISAFSAEHGYHAVRVVVHEDEAYVFPLTVASIDESTFRSAVESSLEENVPIPPANALFEYQIISIDEVRGEAHLSVTVLPEKAVSTYAELLRAGGLLPVSFETEARTLSRALVRHGDEGAHALLHIGRRHSVIAIVERGTVSFSSSVGIGSVDIINIVSKSLSISLSDAEKLILDKGFEINKEDMRIFDAAMPILSTLHDEIGKMLVYWKARNKKGTTAPISDIIVSGKYALMNGVVKYISVTSQLPARVGSVWTNILDTKDIPPDISERDSLDYGSLIGTLI